MGPIEGREPHFSMIDSKSISTIKVMRVAEKAESEVLYLQISKAFELPLRTQGNLEEKDSKMLNLKSTQTIDIEVFVGHQLVSLVRLSERKGVHVHAHVLLFLIFTFD